MRWCSELPDEKGVVLVSPCAAADGTTFVAYVPDGGEMHEIARYSGDGRFQEIIHRATLVHAITCQPDGSLWISGMTDHASDGARRCIACLDPGGDLAWKVFTH